MPQHVVCYEHTARSQVGLDDRQGVRISRLLDVIENYIERTRGLAQGLYGLAHAKLDQVRKTQRCQVQLRVSQHLTVCEQKVSHFRRNNVRDC